MKRLEGVQAVLSAILRPSPIPLLRRTPQANQTALDKFRASSSVPSVFASLNLPKGENRSRRYRTRATTCTDTITRIQSVLLNGCRKDTKVDDLDGCAEERFFVEGPRECIKSTNN